LGSKYEQYQARQLNVLQSVQYISQGYNLFPDYYIVYSYLNISRLSKYNLDYTNQNDGEWGTAKGLEGRRYPGGSEENHRKPPGWVVFVPRLKLAISRIGVYINSGVPIPVLQ
jgi:hypothetical protein